MALVFLQQVEDRSTRPLGWGSQQILVIDIAGIGIEAEAAGIEAEAAGIEAEAAGIEAEAVGIGFPAASISVRYPSIPVPLWGTLIPVPDSRAFRHLTKLHKGMSTEGSSVRL